jgi:hypothetical protein
MAPPVGIPACEYCPYRQHHVPVNVEADAVGPGVGRIFAVVLVAGVDDLFDLCNATGEDGIRLVNMEAILSVS